MPEKDIIACATELFEAHAERRLSLRHFVELGEALRGPDDPGVARVRLEYERAAARRALERDAHNHPAAL